MVLVLLLVQETYVVHTAYGSGACHLAGQRRLGPEDRAAPVNEASSRLGDTVDHSKAYFVSLFVSVNVGDLLGASSGE